MKQLSGILVATALVAVNAFAMDSAATTTMTATGTVMATGTMMKHDDSMMKKMDMKGLKKLSVHSLAKKL